VARSAGRPVDVVPDRQTALDLVAAMPPPSAGERLLLAQGDRADPAHADAFRSRGFDVTAVVAYRTVLRFPTERERAAALDADAVAFASGSAAQAWFDAIGVRTPPVVAAIGPSTAAAAEEVGIKVTVVAADHSIDGLAEVIVRAFAPAS
jgi:uroporphyrinogen-III synthase